MNHTVVFGVCALMAFGGMAWGQTAPGKLTSVQRLEPAHLKAMAEARKRWAAERKDIPNYGIYEDYRAVIHVHAEDAPHTKGMRTEVLAAAKETGVKVVMWTDHGGPKTNTWRGLKDGVLFIAGGEHGDEGELRFPDYDANGRQLTAGMKFISHVEERYDVSPQGYAGLEIVNRHTDAKLDTGLHMMLLAAANNPERWQALVSGFKQYPDEFFGAGNDYRKEIAAKWDRDLAKVPLTAIGANDAHQNQIFNGVTFDPYAVSFRNLSTHILAQELTEPAIREALQRGHAYVSHDWMCDPTGFTFGAVNNLGVFCMGDSAPMNGTTRLIAMTPVSAHWKLFRNGTMLVETNGAGLTNRIEESGVYRVEAWLAVDGEERPWIYSNPIHVKGFSLGAIKLPSTEPVAGVEVKKDIEYVPGQEADLGKHQLDLYIPTSTRPAPVFVFLHGGAWRFGDRSQYLAFGNQLAKDGLLVVIPSYRLAPKNPYPAQIDDAAAAVAWTLKNIAQYGGDTNAIFVGGHSAGGHLTGLLALDERHLKKHGLSTTQLAGALCLSGVYNFGDGESLANIFGSDPEFRKAASPFHQIHRTALPFLVTYCEWDYPTLPAQARQFHRALQKTGVTSDLFYTAGQNHISEVLAMLDDKDSTRRAVVEFIKKHAHAGKTPATKAVSRAASL